MTEPDAPTQADRSVLKVVRGTPTPEELAALVPALLAATSGPPSVAERPRGQWRSRGRNVRPSLGHGPGAWRASGLPR